MGNRFKLIIEDLNKIYRDCRFQINSRDNEIELLYDNRNLINDSKFLGVAYDVSSEYLTQEELYLLVISYDLFKEINVTY